MAKNMKKFNFKAASAYHKEWSTYVFDIIGRPLSVFLVKFTSITPNQVSYISFVLGVLGAYFILLGGYKNLVIGGSLAFAYNIFDMIDGRVARARGVSTVFGKWLDGMIDFTIFPLLIFALALSLKSYWSLVLGMLAIMSYPTHYLIVHFYKSEIVGKKDLIPIPGKFEWVRHVYGSNFFYLFFFAACLANKPMWILIFWATFGNLYWVVLMIVQYLNIRKL